MELTGSATRVGASELGSERVSMELTGSSDVERKTTSKPGGERGRIGGQSLLSTEANPLTESI
jgi:hypothetical protein